MTTIYKLAQGQRIRFIHKGQSIVGTVNAEPYLYRADLFIPVYVHETDKCMVIDARNLVDIEGEIV